MSDPQSGFAVGLVMMLNSLPRQEAEQILRSAVASYFLSGSNNLDEGILRLTAFAGVLHQTGMHHASHGGTDKIEAARAELQKYQVANG